MKQQIRYFAAVGIVAFVLVAATPVMTTTASTDSDEEGKSSSGLESDKKALKYHQKALRVSQ